MFKKLFLLSSCLIFLLCPLASAAADKQPDTASVIVDGVTIDMPAVIENSTLYLPLRAIAEKSGYFVQWQHANGIPLILCAKDGKNIIIDVNDKIITINGHEFPMNTGSQSSPLIFYKGRAYLVPDIFAQNFAFNYTFDEQSRIVSVSNYNENPVVLTNMNIDSANDIYIVRIQYPQISSLANENAAAKINAELRSSAVNAIDVGLQNAFENSLINRRFPDRKGITAETNFNYAITYNQNGLLSLKTDEYQYAGGAHGSTIQTGYTFDLETGDRIKLSDLLNGGYLPVVNAEIRRQIDERVKAGQLFENTKFETITDETGFYLSDKGIVIFFQQYEYFPYAAGIQEFTIPYCMLKDYLQAEFAYLCSEPPSATSLTAGNNLMTVGDTAAIILKGNPTTGYTWHLTMEKNNVVSVTENPYVADSSLIGSGGTFSWTVSALHEGQTRLTFKYYRSWEGEASATAENTKEYLIAVKK